jgi:tyrosinase
MSTIQELAARTEVFLKRPPNKLPVDVKGFAREFVIFLPLHVKRALELAHRFMELADANPGERGLSPVLDEAEAVALNEDIEMVKYALMVFIIHHPEGRKLPIPSLAERSPEKVPPSNKAVFMGLVAMGALGGEAKLDYFREDTWVNEHHSRWHSVYLAAGQDDPHNPAGPKLTRNRQGELFWYMHQQMLARYDTERNALKMNLTVSLDEYTKPIIEGYKANLENFSDRLADATMHDIQGNFGIYSVADHAQRRDRLRGAAKSGQLQRNGTIVPVTIELLSATLESNVGSVEGKNWWQEQTFYGSHHNWGHVLLADLADPNGHFPDVGGVMRDPDTAVRDPVFFRWHRHVDDTIFMWQETLKPYDLKVDAPQVRIRKSLNGAPANNESPDILVCMQKEIPGAEAPDFDGQKFADEKFGGDVNWDKPLASLGFGSGELHTRMKEELISTNGSTGKKPYLDHEEFYYFLRLENLLNHAQKVTVRIFLSARELADDRRMWIEMDKFAQALDPNQKAVIFRPGRYSAVVRKPARRPTEPSPKPHPGDDPNYCDCGWPYHLLLPRGKPNGMDFRLLVMLTDYQADLVGAEKKCGSMSFCGVKDADYPDKRPMGYPFDHPFADKISSVFNQPDLLNLATKDIKIRLLA